MDDDDDNQARGNVAWFNQNEQSLQKALSSKTELEKLYDPQRDAEAVEAALSRALLVKRTSLIKRLLERLRSLRDRVQPHQGHHRGDGRGRGRHGRPGLNHAGR